MDQIVNLKLARLLISMMWLSTLLVSVISYTYPLPATNDAERDMYDTDSPLMPDLQWVRYLLSSQDPKLSAAKRSVERPGEHTEQKRMQFGFSGLDTLDHILTTLDRKPKPGGGNERSSKTDKDIYYLMKVNG